MSKSEPKKLPPGVLTIEIIRGGKLTDKALIGTQSPFVVMKIGHHRLVTKVCNSGGSEPVWKQGFDIKVDENTDPDVHIEVWSKSIFSDIIIGKQTINLYTFWENTPVKGGWWRIQSKQYAHKTRGELLYRIRFNGQPHPKQIARLQKKEGGRHRGSVKREHRGSVKKKEGGGPPPPPPPSAPKPTMLWEVVLSAGLSVRTKPSMNGTQVTLDGKKPIILPMGTLVSSTSIHKSIGKLKNGKHFVTYWTKHSKGWSCCKYGHQQTMVPLSSLSIYEVVSKDPLSVRTTPGINAPRTNQIVRPGQILLARQVKTVQDNKQVSTWLLHVRGWSCGTLGKDNFIVQIMFRKAFQVVLKNGLSIRDKPSLTANTIGKLELNNAVILRDITSHKEKDGNTAIWIRHLLGWSCIKLGNLITMAPMGQGKAWWTATQSVSVRTMPSIEAPRSKHNIHEGTSVVSRSISYEAKNDAFWIKHRMGYSCLRLKDVITMKPQLGAELWQITCENGVYIHSKAGSRSDVILGHLDKGDLFISKGQISIEATSKLPVTTWVRHGQGWTCIKLGDDLLARPVVPGKLSELKQKPHKSYTQKELQTNVPVLVAVQVESSDKKIVQAVSASSNGTKNLGYAANEGALADHLEDEEIVEAIGEAFVVGNPVVINPPEPVETVALLRRRSMMPTKGTVQANNREVEDVVHAEVVEE